MTNPLNYAITSRFGVDRSYTVNGVYYKDTHDGVDFAYPQGTVVTLPPDGSWDGTVIVAQLDQHGGAWVDVRADSDGGVARFLHFSRIDVKVGQKVKSNDVLGLSGGIPGTWGAGLSDGSHLHIGLFVNGVATDPLPWLQKSYSTISQPAPSPAEPPMPQPQTQNNFVTVQVGWGLSSVAYAAGLPTNESTYIDIYNLNPGHRGSTDWRSLNTRMGAGDILRVRPEPTPQPQVDSVNKIPEPIIPAPLPIQPQPEAITTPAQPPMPTVSIEKPFIFSDPAQPQLPEPEPIQQTTATITMTTEPKKEVEKLHLTEKNEKPTIWEKLKSRKLWAVIVGVAYSITSVYYPELQSVLPYLITLVGSYVGVEGIADILERNKR